MTAVREMYNELRAKHPLIEARTALAWARDILKFRWGHPDFPALDGTTDKTIHHSYQGIDFTTRVECDPDAGHPDGSFSNEKKSKWALKNERAWREKNHMGYSKEYMWWNPTGDPMCKIKTWSKHGCSKSVAYEKCLALLRQAYKADCEPESFYLVVKVYLRDTKLGDASLGALDRTQIEGEDSKVVLAELFGVAVQESVKTLASITKDAAKFRKAARRFL